MPTYTNEQLGEALGQLIADFDTSVASDRIDTLKTGVATLFEDAGMVLPVELAEQLQAHVETTEEWILQFRDWIAGTATGGPNSDGYYPITDRNGGTVLLPSPAKLTNILFHLNPMGTVANEAGLTAHTATADPGDFYVALDTGNAWMRTGDGAATDWTNLGSLIALGGQIAGYVPCIITQPNVNRMYFTAAAGWTLEGTHQLIGGIALETNTGGLIVEVDGLTPVGDPRQVRLPGAVEQVPPGTIQAGSFIQIKYLPDSGLFELVTPTVAGSSAGGTNYYAPIEQTNSSATSMVFALAPGVTLPTDLDYVRFVATYINDPTEGGLTCEIAGFNTGDARQLVLPSGDQVPQGTLTDGMDYEFKWSGTNFILTSPQVSATGVTTGIIRLQQTNSDPTALVADALDVVAGAITDAYFLLPIEYTQTTGNISLEVTGLNTGDPRVVYLPSGILVPTGYISAGAIAVFRFDEIGRFILVGTLGGTSGGSSTGDPYVEYLGAAAAAKAVQVGLENSAEIDTKLPIDDPTFTGVLSIGDATWQGSNPAFVHARTIGSGDTATSPHAFSDSAALSFGGSLAYNSFEARFQVSGSGDYHHFAGFQANFLVATTGTTTDAWSYFSAPTYDDGTVTNAYGFEVMSFRGDATYGTVYGILIRNLDRGTTRYGIKQEGVNDLNSFAGRLDVANYIRATDNDTPPTSGKGIELNFNPSFNAGQGAGNLLAVDRATTTYLPLFVDGLYLNLRVGGTDRLSLTGTSLKAIGATFDFATPVTIASAATTNIAGAASNRVNISGTTTITALGTADSGAIRSVRFTGVLTLTHNSTSLILPTGANITTEVDDEAEFISLGSGNWRCTRYSRATGKALVETTPDRSLPSVATILRDEFMICTAEGGEVGELGWNIGGAGSGAAAVAAEAGHPGVIFRNTGTTINTLATLFMGAAGSTEIIKFSDFSETIWVVKPTTTDADHKVRFGLFADVSSDTPTHGVYFERLGADANWFAVCRNGGTETRTSMGVAYANAWFTLKIRKVDASNVAFSIDGGAETTVSATVPDATDGMGPGCQIMNTTAVDKSMRVDFFSLKTTALAR